jgi:ssDNA-binding Zn-finger/Zn-ribbon topoisomerase 1
MFNEQKAHTIHNNKYDYSKVVYKNIDTKVSIICKIHKEFLQTPYHHINRKQGCPQCKGSRISKSKAMSLQDFVDKANILHNNKYDYSKIEKYTNAHTSIIIVCKKHGEFLQTPNNHLYAKNGCPSCGYNTSNTANEWLDSLNIPKQNREVTIIVNGIKYKVDALHNNTIYEYFGNFWHGNPEIFDPNDVNPRNKETYGNLYNKTLEKISNLEKSSYKFIYLWGP